MVTLLSSPTGNFLCCAHDIRESVDDCMMSRMIRDERRLIERLHNRNPVTMNDGQNSLYDLKQFVCLFLALAIHMSYCFTLI